MNSKYISSRQDTLMVEHIVGRLHKLKISGLKHTSCVNLSKSYNPSVVPFFNVENGLPNDSTCLLEVLGEINKLKLVI